MAALPAIMPKTGENIMAGTNEIWEIGKFYFIRTVTMNNTGRLVAVTDHELVLEDAAWIADSSRFSDALKDGSFNEVEPFPEGKVMIGRGALVDACQITKLPRTQK
jgi:hypothetical protein